LKGRWRQLSVLYVFLHSQFFYRTRRELERWLVEGGEGMREEYALVSRLVLKLNQGACAAGHRVDNRHLLQTSRNDGT
jgi:hypothetical protein